MQTFTGVNAALTREKLVPGNSMKKILEKGRGESQGNLTVRKSGNGKAILVTRCVTTYCVYLI